MIKITNKFEYNTIYPSVECIIRGEEIHLCSQVRVLGTDYIWYLINHYMSYSLNNNSPAGVLGMGDYAVASALQKFNLHCYKGSKFYIAPSMVNEMVRQVPYAHKLHPIDAERVDKNQYSEGMRLMPKRN